MELQDFAKQLEPLSKEKLIELLYVLSQMSPDNQKYIDRYCEKPHQADPAEMLLQQKLLALWDLAREVIEEVNEYGGCSYTDEERAAAALYEMENIGAELDINWDFRRKLIDEMMDERCYENSGFEDQLFDVSHTFCRTPYELGYLASLFSTEVRHEAHRAASIYEEAGMKEQALALRLNTLESESDYLQIAHQYEADHQWRKAEDILLKGLKESRSHTKERMTRHLAELYVRHHQSDKLEALRQWILQDDNPYEIQGIGCILYQDAKRRGNYERMKELLEKMIATAHGSELDKWYHEARQALSPQDFEQLLPLAFQAGLERNIEFYLDLCMENDRHDEVIRYLQENVSSSNWDNHWGFWVDKDHKYSAHLEEDYPDEIYEYYKAQAESRINWMGDHNYFEAGRLLERMRSIRTEQDRLSEFEEYLEELHVRHAKKRKFLSILHALKENQPLISQAAHMSLPQAN